MLNEGAIYNVESVNMPDSLRVMHSNCLSLEFMTELTLPDSISEIHENAIICPLINKLTVLNPTPPTIYGSDILSADEYPVLFVPKGSVQAYRKANGWSNFQTIIELESSSIDNVDDKNDKVCIKVTDGQLSITGCESVCIYNSLGMSIYIGQPDNLSHIEHGVYIIRADKKISKVVL